MQVSHSGLARQTVQMQRQLNQHALGKVADGGNEQRARRQAGVFDDFSDVFVC